MKFDRKVVFVARLRQRARKHGCKGCGRKVELGVKGPSSLNAIVRGGASVEKIKAVIREDGWYCRGCVRKWRGTAASTPNLRDQFPPGPDGEKLYNWHRYQVCKPELEAAGYDVIWNEDQGNFTMALRETA